MWPFSETKKEPAKNPKLWLRRGLIEEVYACIPSYIGEMILCTDTPVLCVANKIELGGFMFMEIPKEVQSGFLIHYGQILTWRKLNDSLRPLTVQE